MALKNYKSKGDIASPTMAPITFSRKRHGGNRSGETEIASGLPTDVDIDLKEVYFLIMHFLSLGPCQRTYAQIWNELLEHELLPRRYHAWYSRKGAPSGDENDNGYSLPLSYSSLVDRYSHIERDHLVKLFKQLILCCSPPLNGIAGGNPPNAANVPTLLGSGSFSLLESHKDRELKRAHCSSQYLWWPHMHADQVHGLSLREIGGGFTKHHRAPSIHAACHAIAKPETIMQKMQVIKKLRGHQNAVYCAIFDRSGRYLITGSDDRLVKIWSLETAFCLSSCRGHEGDITDLAVSVNNALVASASNDFVIRVWRLPDGLPISVLRGHTGVVTAIVFSPRPSSAYHLLSSSDDGTCRIWDSRSSQTCPRVYIPKPSDSGHGNPNPNVSQPQPNHQILCCSFNSSGTVFVTGSADTYARVFNACRSITEDSEPPNHEIDLLSGHENDVNYVQFSGCAVTSKFSINDSSKEDNLPRFKNSWFNLDNIVTCSRDGSAIIWTPRSRRSHGKSGRWIRAYHLKVPPPPVPPQPARGGPRQRLQPTPRGVNMIVWSLDNHFVLAAIMDCRICVWNASDGSLVHSLLGHNESTFVLDVHPFDPRIAMTAGYDGKVIVWDIWKGAAVREYETGHFKLVDGRFSPDGTSVVVSDEVGQIFIIGTGQGESQKDAKYDQFFLGDYRPLIRDTQGNVLDQESQLPPYRRNIQDQLCDASMIPYPEPYQSTYQRRRLSAIGMEWRPPSVKFAVGPSSIAGDYQILPFPDLDRWVEPIPEFLDAMEWEENEVQSDDADSEYNVTEECSTEDEQGSVGSSPESSECSAEESEAGDENVDGLRRSKRKKVKSEVELTTSSGRRVKRRNLDGNDDHVVKSTKKRKRKKGRLTSKKKKSKAKPHRPQRRAARNALTFLSQIGEASTDGEDEDEGDSESCSSDNSAIPDSNTPSNESDRSMSNYNSNNAHGKANTTDEAADVTKPVVISDPQAGAGNRRRLVLKLSIRDAKKVTPVKPQNGSLDECKDIMELEVNKSPISDQKQSWDPGQTSEGRVGTIVSPDEIGSSSSEFSEKPEDQPGISAVRHSAKIRWGEVKMRSAKRFRVNDGSVADAWPAADSNFENHDHLANNSNGCLEHEAVSPHSQIHTYEDKGSFTRELVNEHSAGYVSEMVNVQNSSSCIHKKPTRSDQQYPIVSASTEKNIPMVTYNEGKNKCRQQAGNGFESSPMIKDNGKNESEGAHAQHNPILDQNGRHVSGQSDVAGNGSQHVYRRLKFTSRKTLGESSTSYSRSTPSGEHWISDDLATGSSSCAERDPLSVVHEEDVGSTGESDYGDWTNGSASLSNGRSPKRESIKLKISRGGNSEEVTNSVPDYENPRTNSFRRTRSHGLKAMASESNSLLRSCRFRESYDYAEASKSGFRFSLRNGQPRTDEKLNSKATVGLRSTRNRRENYDVDDLYTLDRRKGQNPVKKLSWLMLSEHEECYRYIPQLGDEVVYLRQGHEEYLKNIRSSESGPWKFVGQELRAVEFCKVENLDYATLPGSGESCCKLTLVFTDPSSGGYGKGFKLTLPELVEFPDFLVERTRYDSAIERNWTYRDKCQVWWRNDGGDGGSWWEGRILSVKQKSQAFPDSPWENIIIQYKNDSSDQHLHCPWELHDVGTHWEHPCIDDATKKKLLATIIKIEKTSQRSRDTCGLEKLSQVSQKSDFLNRFPVPLSLELVKRRLENDYYRTVEAVKHDLRVTISNAQAYFSKSVEYAAKMRKLSDLISGAFDL